MLVAEVGYSMTAVLYGRVRHDITEGGNVTGAEARKEQTVCSIYGNVGSGNGKCLDKENMALQELGNKGSLDTRFLGRR